MWTLYRAGFRDGGLELTNEGEKELMAIVAVKFEDELTTVAREKIAEEEKKKD